MAEYHLTKEQARRFLLLKKGLLGKYKFEGKQGVYDYVKQAGCVQYDPIDVCGKNAELVLQSRVWGFEKHMLDELLYKDRQLIDYFDKNMSVFCTDDWKYFLRIREEYRKNGHSRDKIDEIAEDVKKIIREKKYASSKDLGFNDSVNWPWGPTRLSRAALETLYYRGELIIHHKKGTIKHYGLAEEYIDKDILNADDPNLTEFEFTEWRVLRRIGSVGLLWNKPSDAWLGIGGMKSTVRNKVFSSLINKNKVIACKIEGIKDEFYLKTEDSALVDNALESNSHKPRLEFLAPLDNLLWDRRLIKSVFGFDYKWEIYTPLEQRKYGYYTLPVLYGDKLVGRIEVITDKKKGIMQVKNLWFEGEKPDIGFEESLKNRLIRFAQFNMCEYQG